MGGKTKEQLLLGTVGSTEMLEKRTETQGHMIRKRRRIWHGDERTGHSVIGQDV